MQTWLIDFRVLPQYAGMESEADQLTRQINDPSNANVINTASIRDLETAMRSEAPPPIDELESIYAEAGVSLPGLAITRYGEVRSFHESVIRNRRDYLAGELDAAKQRVVVREQEKQRLDERRAEVMNILKSHGALDQFSKLQAETARKEAEVESLRQRFESRKPGCGLRLSRVRLWLWSAINFLRRRDARLINSVRRFWRRLLRHPHKDHTLFLFADRSTLPGRYQTFR